MQNTKRFPKDYGTTKTMGDKTVIKSMSLGGLLGGTAECMVDVKDGRMLRMRPFQYNWKYDEDKLNRWKLERNGVT